MNSHQLVEHAGLYFHANSQQQVRAALAKYAQTDTLVRVWYGDTETGRTASSEMVGFLGISPGAVPVVVVRRTETSVIGTPVRADAVIRIDLIGNSLRGQALAHTVYQHPSFMPGRWKVEETTLPAYLADEAKPTRTTVRATAGRAGIRAPY